MGVFAPSLEKKGNYLIPCWICLLAYKEMNTLIFMMVL